MLSLLPVLFILCSPSPGLLSRNWGETLCQNHPLVVAVTGDTGPMDDRRLFVGVTVFDMPTIFSESHQIWRNPYLVRRQPCPNMFRIYSSSLLSISSEIFLITVPNLAKRFLTDVSYSLSPDPKFSVPQHTQPSLHFNAGLQWILGPEDHELVHVCLTHDPTQHRLTGARVSPLRTWWNWWDKQTKKYFKLNLPLKDSSVCQLDQKPGLYTGLMLPVGHQLVQVYSAHGQALLLPSLRRDSLQLLLDLGHLHYEPGWDILINSPVKSFFSCMA